MKHEMEEEFENAKLADTANRFLAAMNKISEELHIPIFTVAEIGGVPIIGGSISSHSIFSLVDFLHQETPADFAMSINILNEKRAKMIAAMKGDNDTIH